MDNEILTQLSKRIESYRNDIVRLQKDLTAIPALGPENGGEGEAKKAEYIREQLKPLNFDHLDELRAPDDRVPSGYRPNLLAKISGKSNRKTIWIMSHMDIVPPGERSLWKTDPYEVVEKDGKLYGRGTEDDQQGIVSSLLAVRALREEDVQPEYDVGLAIVSDEEAGSKFGIEYVLKERSDLFRPDDLIIIPDAGDPEGITIEVAEKSILWIKCETQGKQTHGSTPEKGINAHKAAAHLIVRMNELYDRYDHNDPVFDPPTSTFEPTKKDTNVDNINTIPGKDVCYFDCRILPDYTIKEIQKQIRRWADDIEKRFGVTIQLSYPQIVEAPPPTPTDAPVVLALKRAVKDITGGEAKIIGIGGGTVAAFFRKAGLPAVCWCTLDDTLHAPNEYSKIENVIQDARVFAHVFLQE